MIFYGDAVRDEAIGDLAAEIAGLLALGLAGAGTAIDRHGALVAALVLAGQLAQGVADLAPDAADPGDRTAMDLAHRLAGLVWHNWRGGLAATLGPLAIGPYAALARVEATPGSRRIRVSQPEGYAHYAVYPEAYAEAARTLGPVTPATVIGVRSIGTSLGAMAAAALGAPSPLSVRPVGPPFAREIRDARLAAALRRAPGATFVIADEGPGLSGSSFGAVADALEDGGVAPDRIVCLPSHPHPPGPMSSARHRARWSAIRRPVVTFDDLALGSAGPAHRLDSWVADITGPLATPVEDLSGGRWRDRAGSRHPAPIDPQNERRKFLLTGRDGTFVLKFAGLGGIGHRKFARARALAAAGYTLAPVALRHGFLVEPWRDDLARLDPAGLDRGAFVAHLGRYLGFRARSLPAGADGGASLEALLAMTCANARERFGPAAGSLAARWAPRLPGLAAGLRRTATDNRLHAWEWLRTPDGGWLKTDALDHCVAHDLVGCQDIAWDLGGAATEFDLGADEADRLSHIVRHESGRATDPALVRFCHLAYAAFQLGLWTLAGDRGAPGAAAAAERYAEQLWTQLHSGP